jgi:hypothetical protein
MKKRIKIEEIKRLFEAHEKLTIKELKSYINLAERTIRDYLKILVEEKLILAIGETNRRYYQRNYAIDEKPIVIVVLQNSLEVGTISFTYAKGYQFSYSFLYKGERFPSLANEINSSYALFPIFENLIPESTRRERLLLKEGKILNPLELLLELDNTHGSFDFLPLASFVRDDYQTTNKIPNWKSIKETILGTNDFVNLLKYELDIPLEALRNCWWLFVCLVNWLFGAAGTYCWNINGRLFYGA